METQEEPRRRPGPIGFHGEAKSTSLRMPPAANPGGIGEAIGPRAETPRKSRELRVAGPAVWGLVGVGVLVIGAVLLSVLTAIAGVAICVGAFFVSRRNRTESRLRSAFGKSGGS